MSDKQATPKQALLAHIDAMHRRKLPRKRMSYQELGQWHAAQHHHYLNNHVHAGVNLGPDNRPAGWRTGADVVPKRQS